MAKPAPVERILRRDQRVTAVGLVILCALAWGYLAAGAGLGMSLAQMSTTALFPHTLPMSSADPSMMADRWSPGYAALMIAMWWVMMIAMMTPSAAPMILLHARVAGSARARGADVERALNGTAVFAGAYLFVWLAFSVAATALQWALEAAGLVSAMMMWSMSAQLSAAILIAAGIYQWTPLKTVCLTHCRTPVQFLTRHWRPGSVGTARLGVLHGAYCVGCCWALMALLFVGGVMNPLWIAGLAVIVLVEKLTPPGVFVSRWAGAALVVLGVGALLV